MRPALRLLVAGVQLFSLLLANSWVWPAPARFRTGLGRYAPLFIADTTCWSKTTNGDRFPYEITSYSIGIALILGWMQCLAVASLLLARWGDLFSSQRKSRMFLYFSAKKAAHPLLTSTFAVFMHLPVTVVALRVFAAALRGSASVIIISAAMAMIVPAVTTLIALPAFLVHITHANTISSNAQEQLAYLRKCDLLAALGFDVTRLGYDPLLWIQSAHKVTGLHQYDTAMCMLAAEALVIAHCFELGSPGQQANAFCAILLALAVRQSLSPSFRRFNANTVSFALSWGAVLLSLMGSMKANGSQGSLMVDTTFTLVCYAIIGATVLLATAAVLIPAFYERLGEAGASGEIIMT